MRIKRNVAIAGSALAVAAMAGGGAYAATQNSSANPRQAFLSDVAKRLGIPEAKLASAVKAAELDRLNAAVKAGRLTQAQAAAIAKGIQRGALGPGGFGLPRHPGGLRGFGGPGAPGGPGTPGRPGGPLAGAARYLGLTPAQLRNQLQSGKTLAQVARSRGKSASGLEQAMLASVKSRLDHAVSRGWITGAQEQQILSMLSQRIGEGINAKFPGKGFQPHPGLGGHWAPGLTP